MTNQREKKKENICTTFKKVLYFSLLGVFNPVRLKPVEGGAVLELHIVTKLLCTRKITG